jgi:hypothetical protein
MILGAGKPVGLNRIYGYHKFAIFSIHSGTIKEIITKSKLDMCIMVKDIVQ